MLAAGIVTCAAEFEGVTHQIVTHMIPHNAQDDTPCEPVPARLAINLGPWLKPVCPTPVPEPQPYLRPVIQLRAVASVVESQLVE